MKRIGIVSILALISSFIWSFSSEPPKPIPLNSSDTLILEDESSISDDWDDVPEVEPRLINGIWYRIMDSKTAYVEDYDTIFFRNGIVEIPNMIEYNGRTYSVTKVYGYVFRNRASLTSIIIPKNVISMACDFWGSSNVESIIVEKGNPVYDSRDNCNAIIETKTNKLISGCKNTVIPNTIDTISWSAFWGCTSLTAIRIPKSVVKIEYNPFENCPNVESIIVEEGNPVYDSRDNCNAIIETKTNKLISGCKNTVIPNTIDTISWSAFNRCTSLTAIRIPKSVVKIEYNPFENCPNVESIIVEEGNPVYDSRDNCNAIIETKTNKLILGCKNTVIPNTIDTISWSAFDECTSLTKIRIPKNVVKIEYNPFQNCPNVESIIVEEGNPVYDSRFNCNAIIETKTNKLISTCKNTIIPLGIINPSSAYRNYDHEKLILPYGIEEIDSMAMWYNYKIKEIILPNTLTTIRYRAFEGCENLESIYIPNSVTKIEAYAFQNCKRLKSIYIPNSVKEIGYKAFDGCDSLDFVMMPYNENGMYKDLFSDKAPLSNFILSVPNTNSKLSKFTTNWWDKITSVVIEKGLKEIEDDAFRNHPTLKSIVISESVSKFGLGALYYNDYQDTLRIYTTNRPRAMEKSFYEYSWHYEERNNGYYKEKKKEAEEKIKKVVAVNENELAYYQTFSSFATPIITQQLIDWAEQKEGERQAEWKSRVTEETIEAKKKEIYKTIEADYIYHRLPNYKPSFTKGKYIPTEQNFLFYEKTLGIVKVHVPNNEAEYVDKNWDGKSFRCTYYIQKDEIKVETLTIILPEGKTYTTKNE